MPLMGLEMALPILSFQILVLLILALLLHKLDW